jgi:hypothetical protein
MSDSFRETDAIVFRNAVTFQTGFGVMADSPFTIGSPISTNSSLITYNQIIPYGGISGTGIFATSVNLGSTGGFLQNEIKAISENVQNISFGFPNATTIAGNITIRVDNDFQIYDPMDGSNVVDIVSDNYFYLRDLNTIICADIYNRQLKDSSNNLSLDWDKKILSGNWQAQNLEISGNSVINAGQTGNFYANSNPSGYITTGQTGNFINTGQTGVFASKNSVNTINYAISDISYNGVNTSIGNNFGGGVIISPSSFVLFDSANISNVIDWQKDSNFYLRDLVSVISIDVYDRILQDQQNITSIDWLNRLLEDGSGNTSLDWQNKILSGNWKAQNISISGSPVALTNTWSNLTCLSTTLWTGRANVIEDRKILNLTGSTTLNITGLYNGWNGILRTYQSGSGFNLTLPVGTKVQNNGLGAVSLTTGISGAIDILNFRYDGTYLFCSYTNRYS